MKKGEEDKKAKIINYVVIGAVISVLLFLCGVFYYKEYLKSNVPLFCDTVNPGQVGYLTEHGKELCHPVNKCMPCPFEANCQKG